MSVVIDKAGKSHSPITDIPARNRRLIALLDSFDAGNVDDQQHDLALLLANLAESRDGQRALFVQHHMAPDTASDKATV